MSEYDSDSHPSSEEASTTSRRDTSPARDSSRTAGSSGTGSGSGSGSRTGSRTRTPSDARLLDITELEKDAERLSRKARKRLSGGHPGTGTGGTLIRDGPEEPSSRPSYTSFLSKMINWQRRRKLDKMRMLVDTLFPRLCTSEVEVRAWLTEVTLLKDQRTAEGMALLRELTLQLGLVGDGMDYLEEAMNDIRQLDYDIVKEVAELRAAYLFNEEVLKKATRTRSLTSASDGGQIPRIPDTQNPRPDPRPESQMSRPDSQMSRPESQMSRPVMAIAQPTERVPLSAMITPQEVVMDPAVMPCGPPRGTKHCATSPFTISLIEADPPVLIIPSPRPHSSPAPLRECVWGGKESKRKSLQSVSVQDILHAPSTPKSRGSPPPTDARSPDSQISRFPDTQTHTQNARCPDTQISSRPPRPHAVSLTSLLKRFPSDGVADKEGVAAVAAVVLGDGGDGGGGDEDQRELTNRIHKCCMLKETLLPVQETLQGALDTQTATLRRVKKMRAELITLFADHQLTLPPPPPPPCTPVPGMKTSTSATSVASSAASSLSHSSSSSCSLDDPHVLALATPSPPLPLPLPLHSSNTATYLSHPPSPRPMSPRRASPQLEAAGEYVCVLRGLLDEEADATQKLARLTVLIDTTKGIDRQLSLEGGNSTSSSAGGTKKI